MAATGAIIDGSINGRPTGRPIDSRAGLGAAFVKSRAATLLDWAVALWIFSGSFVIFEPAPYELVFFCVVSVSLLAGLAFFRQLNGLLVLFVAFIPFAIVAAFQPKFTELSDALIFSGVTVFLMFTAYWVANYVAAAPQHRMRLIVQAYLLTAVLSALLGTLGYLDILPWHDLLTRYDRAKALFNDSNVFGPFLFLPAMYALQRVLLGKGRFALWGAAAFMVLAIGVFASFSRAAWGGLAAGALILFLLVFFLEANAREKVRMMIIALAGMMAMVVALGGLLSIPSVQKLFETRASAVQSYDDGETGRFGRQGYAFELALANPLGIGPLEFRNLRVKEEPHNSYVNVLHVYGWGGGFVFVLLMLLTLWRAVRFTFIASPNRLLLLPLVAVYIPHVIEAAIIDLDHWRHFFLIAGLIWGVTAGYRRTLPGEDNRHSALI